MGLKDNVITIAKSQIGIEEPIGDDKYIQYYNQLTGMKLTLDVSWCACFQTWVMRMAGVPVSLIPNFCSCTVAVNWAKKQKIWYPRTTGYMPSAGDLVFFDWDGDSIQDHVGLVIQTTTNSIITIEGNTRGSYQVDGVRQKVYSTDSRYILGYINIQYPEPVKQTTTDMNKITLPAADIKNIQRYISNEYNVTLTVDGIWGPKSKLAMIKAVQKTLNLSYGAHLVVDGIWGEKSKAAMPAVKKGFNNRLVGLIQACLMLRGYDLSLDCIFGNETRKTVIAYQTAMQLEADGIVGAITMTKLLE